MSLDKKKKKLIALASLFYYILPHQNYFLLQNNQCSK